MPRQKYETVESVDKELELLAEQQRFLQKKKKELSAADNARLGALIRTLFKKDIPAGKQEQKLFFKNVADLYYREKANNVSSEIDVSSSENDNVDFNENMNVNVTSSEVDDAIEDGLFNDTIM